MKKIDRRKEEVDKDGNRPMLKTSTFPLKIVALSLQNLFLLIKSDLCEVPRPSIDIS